MKVAFSVLLSLEAAGMCLVEAEFFLSLLDRISGRKETIEFILSVSVKAAFILFSRLKRRLPLVTQS